MKRLILIPIFLLSAFAVFTTLRFVNAPTDINYQLTYELPEFSDVHEFVTDKAAKQAAAVDGKILYKNSAEIQPTASTAKTILALMIMEARPFELGQQGETIEITQELYNLYTYQLSVGGSNTAVRIGEEISQYDALAAVLLPSSNNMADSLAIWAFGSLEEYQNFANAKLKEWGINNTRIGSDASGLSEDTTSTVSDLALIAQKFMQNPVLAEIVGLKEHEIPVAGTIKNTNNLLGTDGIIGLKTGYTGAAGYCLITAYRMDEHIVTVATLGAESREESFDYSHQTILELQNNFRATRIAEQNLEIGQHSSWWNGENPIRLDEDIDLLVWDGNDKSATLNMSGDSGELVIKIDGQEYKYAAHAENYQETPSFGQKLKWALDFSLLFSN